MSTLLRVAVAGAAAAAMLGAASAPAAATHPVMAVPFQADHVRDCMYMEAEGHLIFGVAHPGETERVDVRGTLTERELPQAPPDPCEVGGSTFATFEAYAGGARVDDETVRLPDPTSPVNTGVRDFAFRLVNSSSADPILRVDVTVCRDFGPWLPAFTCGPTEQYTPVIAVPHHGAGG